MVLTRVKSNPISVK